MRGKKLRKIPAARNYRPTLLEAYMDDMEKNRAFLERCSYLYDVADGDNYSIAKEGSVNSRDY